MSKSVQAQEAVNANVHHDVVFDLNQAASSTSGNGSVPVGIAATAVAVESGNGVIHQTVITLAALDQLIANGQEYIGTEIYDFPEGRILVLGATASLTPVTTTTIATSIAAGATGHVSLGRVTTSGTNDTDKVDLLPNTAFTSSATINVAPVSAPVKIPLAASAQFDGTTTAIKAFLNTIVATDSIDGHLAWSGTVTLTWVNLGDY